MKTTRPRVKPTPMTVKSVAISKPALRRIANRSGVKIVSSEMITPANNLMVEMLDDLIARAVTISQYCGKKTVDRSSIVYALEMDGNKLYM